MKCWHSTIPIPSLTYGGRPHEYVNVDHDGDRLPTPIQTGCVVCMQVIGLQRIRNRLTVESSLHPSSSIKTLLLPVRILIDASIDELAF